MATKILVNGSTDVELVREFEEKTNSTDCDPNVSWTTPAKGDRTDPPTDTVAIAVVVGSKGAVRIYEQSSGDYIDGVGTKKGQTGSTVIVPWDSAWYFSAAGSPLVGYIKRRG